jgi:addiction module antitoxin, relB/dinJ family
MEDYTMATTNLNIRMDKDIKDKAEVIFSELGMNMTTAINVFLRTTIRENGIPFDLKLDTPNELTISAIDEGRKIAYDDSVKGYSNIDDLRKALEI